MADDVEFSPDWEQAVLKASHPLMRRVNQEIFQDMLRLVPRRTGELADSGKAYTAGNHRYRIRFTAAHWVHVEYGTRFMAAQPFIRPAFLKKREL